MLPERFRLRPVPSSRDQFESVCRLLRDKRFTEVVNACDAGREGELIFRYVYELAGSSLRVRRLWISSMTDEALTNGLAGLRDGHTYDNLAAAARCRSEADWLVGLNATRAVTVRHRTKGTAPLYSIGRVQTPTLGLVAKREQEIRAFVPADYWEIKANLRKQLPPIDGADEASHSNEEVSRHNKRQSASEASGATAFEATWQWFKPKTSRLARREDAELVVQRCQAHAEEGLEQAPVVERVQHKRSREAPPLLFDLTSLQRTANRRFGLSAEQTLQAAQALYERQKLVTYPRTDSRYLSSDMKGEMAGLFRSLAKNETYRAFAQALVAKPPELSKRVFDDKKVSDHHAIIPTAKQAPPQLGRDEARIYDLIVRRFIGVFFPDAVFALSEIVVRVGAAPGVPPHSTAKGDVAQEASAEAGPELLVQDGDPPLIVACPPQPDRFVARGRVRLEPGWQVVAGLGDRSSASPEPARRSPASTRSRAAKTADKPSGPDRDGATLPVLEEGDRLEGLFKSVSKQTRPPPHHTEASLLLAMETAGRAIEDDELREAMKDTGLGTPATRAATIETLIRRQFIRRERKQIRVTETGLALIEALPVPSLASAELTGQWEARLARVARGEDTRAAFMEGITAYVREAVAAISKARLGVQSSASTSREAPPAPRGAASSHRMRPQFAVNDLQCPQCKAGALMAGRRGWGCTRWKMGCRFVVPFEQSGRQLTRAELEKHVASRAAGGP